MKSIIEYFDRSYIINLADRVDRRRDVVREFRRSGIHIPNERVSFYTATRPTDSGNFVTLGMRGCFASHLNVLEDAKRDNLRNVLVLEDDVSFRDVGVDFQNRLLEDLSRRHWDLLWLGYLKPDNVALSGPLARWSNDILGAHCYAVNGRFIGAMAQYMRDCERRPRDHPDGGPMPADGAYNHVRYVNKDVVLLLAVPQLALQRNSRSDVTPNSMVDGSIWLRAVAPFARKIKYKIRMTLDKRRLREELTD